MLATALLLAAAHESRAEDPNEAYPRPYSSAWRMGELDTRPFWKAPDEGEIALLLAYPKGEVIAGVIHQDGTQTLYRIDSTGHTRWELESAGWVDLDSVATTDPAGGLFICVPSAASTRSLEVIHIDAQGRLDWQISSGAKGVALLSPLQACDRLLALSDGSVIVAGRFPGRGPGKDAVKLRFLRIEPTGRIAWSTDIPVLNVHNPVTAMATLPSGDILLLLNSQWPGNSSEREFLGGDPPLQRRLSPSGQVRPLTPMESGIPPAPNWGGFEDLFLSERHRLVRISGYWDSGGWVDGDRGYCRYLAEEWTGDGRQRLAMHDLTHLPPIRHPLGRAGDSIRYLTRHDSRDFYLVECGYRFTYVAAVADDWSSAWYSAGVEDIDRTAASKDRLFTVVFYNVLYSAPLPNDDND